tara:strand:- start:378 stop:701 length:324 start_codon:yes stop_codon:yes gene_type:complete
MKQLLLIFLFSLLLSCNTDSSTQDNHDVSVCSCLETKYSELTKISEQEFDKQCNALFSKLGLEKILKRTKKCDLKRIQDGAFKGEVIESIDDLNRLIAFFFYGVELK